MNLHVQECFWVPGCVGKRHDKSVQILTECLNLCYWVERGVLSFLFLSKSYWGGVLDPSWRRQSVSETSDPPCKFLPRINLSVLWKSDCFVLGTIHVKLGLWRDTVVLVKMVLSFVLALAFTAFTECLASTVVHQQRVCLCSLLVVSWPRATLWNKPKPLDHQLILQKWILFQIPLLLCEILGFISLAGWLWQSYHITARSGLSVKPLTLVAFLIPEDATHKGHPWHLCASKFLPAYLDERQQVEDLNENLARAAVSSRHL